MNNVQKFQDLLKKLFQFEASDLDFGIYRILNYKRERIEKFINEDLKNKVESAFAKYKDERLGNINKRLEEVKEELLETARKLGKEPITATGDLKDEFKDSELGIKYLSLKIQKDEAQVIDEIKLQVFNDLYNFFSRYYEEGDFVPHYRYSIKGHKYAIPYNGEEVKLYWANADQYYTKTGLLFRDYTFKADDYKIIFRIVSAKEELASNKATKERFFVLDDENPVEVKGKEVIIRFQYRELFEDEKLLKKYEEKFRDKKSKDEENENKKKQVKQEKLNQILYSQILNNIQRLEIKKFLTQEYKRDKDDKPVDYLLYHLNRFTSKNTKDYFIHKNLKKFLAQQLDYFIKAEVLDIETLGKERFLDKHITRAKVVREIGEDIIDFLSQIEDFQKRLWEKKKFVLKTEYVITTDRVPKEFYDEIWQNKKQRKEWEDLGFEIPQTQDELKSKKLPIDTKYFSQEFKEKLLERLTENGNLDDLLDGLLIKSENFQALNLLLSKYKEKVQTIYIDPPYNTGSDEFLYRDRYQHSSWLTMMENRLSLAKEIMKDNGVIFVSIDDNEVNNLISLCKICFGDENFLINIPWKARDSISNDAIISQNHHYLTTFIKNKEKLNIGIHRFRLAPEKKGYSNPDNDPRGPWKLVHIEISGVHISPGLIYEIEDPYGNKFFPKDGSCWRFSKETFNKYISEGRIHFDPKGKSKPRYKQYLSETLKTLSSWFDNYGTTTEGTNEVKEIFGRKKFNNPKPTRLLKEIINLTSYNNEIILDFFAGSGTTAHAVMKLNKEDGGKRKFILVEMADYFDTVIIPRLKKVAYSFNWKDGKPQDNDGIGVFFKYQILEQYEDTLDNIELKENQKALELFQDKYLLKYFLDFETRESPYLLNIEMLKNPFAYKLKVNFEEVGEPEERVVDIPETFNYLLGLKVKKIKTRMNERKYLFILGEKEGRNIAIVWREYSYNWTDKDFERDKEFIIKEIESWAPQIVYVNGQSVLTPKLGEHTVEIRYIESEFKNLMG